MLIIKNITDKLLALILLIVLSPLFIFLALRLWIKHGGNPFFVQVRVGKENKPFRMYKFRTYRDEHCHDNTSFICYLRKTHLDELPQFINVLLGSMSLVGPRPHTQEHVSLYEPWQTKRLQVKPGITCLRQLNVPDKKLEFNALIEEDIRYVEQWNLTMDLKILLQTSHIFYKLIWGKPL